MRPDMVRKLEITLSIGAMAASAWLVVSVLVMAGMRGAFGSSPIGERIRLWQYLNCSFAAVLQIAATVLMVGFRYSATKCLTNERVGGKCLQDRTVEKYAKTFVVCVGITSLLTFALAALRN